jgi:hypothetical protein
VNVGRRSYRHCGGASYGSRAGWGGPHYGGGLLGLVLIILLILWLTGNLGGGPMMRWRPVTISFHARLHIVVRSASATLAVHRSALDSDVQIARVDDLVEAVGDETCCCHAEKPAAHPSRLCGEDAQRRRRGADLGRIAEPTRDDDAPSQQRKHDSACRHAEPAEGDRPLAGFASHLCDIEIAFQSAGNRRVDLLYGEADEAEPREHDEPITERPRERFGGNRALADAGRVRQPAIDAECLQAQRRVHDPERDEARTDREATPGVPEAVWIEDTLEEAPGGVTEKPNGGDEQQGATERLGEDCCEGAARPCHSSAEMGRDLEGQRADDHIDHTLHEEARAGEQFERAEPGHGSMVCQAHGKSPPRRRLTRGFALDDDERRTPMVRAAAVVAGTVLLVAGTGG